ncbi:DUF3419 family protein [Nanoarchaeota archaeon]
MITLVDIDAKSEIEGLEDIIADPELVKTRKFGKFSQIYSFATENLSYMPEVVGRRVLTVSGSGDQVINAYLCGAEQVDSFDINLLSAFMTDLKLTALEKLWYHEYMDFFMREDEEGNPNEQAFNTEYYSWIRNKLNPASRVFWDKLYEHFDGDGTKIRESVLFNNKYDNNAVKIMSNPYLQNEQAYEKAKKAARGKETKWMLCPAHELADRIQWTMNGYNTILLSNIADYAKSMYEGPEYLKEFRDAVVNPLRKHLAYPEPWNPRAGKLCAAYVYDSRAKGPYRSEVDDPEIRRKVFGRVTGRYEEIEVEGVMEGKSDCIVVLTA